LIQALFRKIGDWLTSHPLFKKGSKSCGNYRPVSLTSSISKLMEKLLKDKIFEYVVEYGLIKDSQHGFISKKSCLLHFFEIVTDYVDNGCPVDVLSLDFQKAFDKVPPSTLAE